MMAIYESYICCEQLCLISKYFNYKLDIYAIT